ncbi:MAG: group III truncated hemoglobin [Taibaiella sp.]|nr:group III truncated hemoglobin [Taibaiella sp.]
MNDIAGKDDIQTLVDSFYAIARQDDLLGPIFNTIIGDDWSHHLPVMYDFWNMVIFAVPGYTGQPVKKHVDIDKRMPMNKEHFDRWLELWTATVDKLFTGEYADIARNKAALMANMIHIKVEMGRKGFETLN